MAVEKSNKRAAPSVNVTRLLQMKAAGEVIACLTAYDHSLACVVDEAGVDVILVGDTLGMVIQGHETTLSVSVDDVIYHTRCVAAAHRRALIMADMPFMSYLDEATALRNAGRLMQEGGARMVKLEGTADQVSIVAALARAGVPVCAHLGLLPQRIHKLGGYKVQGRDRTSAHAMIDDAHALEAAGADLLLVECIPAALGERLAHELRIPVIGIGAGSGCDGQILVLQDLLGITPGRPPRFAKDFMTGAGNVQTAVQEYVAAVKARRFPDEEHCF
ncbi:3-methyl-2-oxobutanoate hydroxymethyltransferase [Nitrococcus mobilis]|uniref:3-methyl-2-oxobutanoate hydroxymethyltransferase n=1 Tax=Nitrococcus mobilis Nb-231 TaxID=314278 RepID=A4BLN5_9GAMM|nr:3-methyl-2-oxobutanoate hydroxymethyltransferase [Nitrococcus mobilis]EAR23223.1 3-methyl-2-oxobutanoate hydroxymethyltransferase [Nitrococcus mobilis Nb-231]